MASFSVPCPKCDSFTRSSSLVPDNSARFQKVSGFHGSNSTAFSGFQGPKKQSSVWKVQAQLNDDTAKLSLNSAPVEPTSSKEKVLSAKRSSRQTTIADVASITAFMTQVKDLVKLVDSRDILELEMKQTDCEILIRKKDALPQPPAAPVYQMQPSYAHVPPPPPPSAQSIAPATPARSAPPLALPALAKASSSSHPPLKCPMAGTFYRCSGPGEPPFVKVGDKVQKGQVICIIEAMKLMNEIEADQSGTVTEVLAEDAKPVSVDTPLFVIVP